MNITIINIENNICFCSTEKLIMGRTTHIPLEKQTFFSCFK